MSKPVFAFLAIALSVVFAGSAHALVLGLPDAVEFHGTPVELSFAVRNAENVSRPLEINVFLPVEHQFVQKPGTLKAGETAAVKLMLFPRPELIGSRYTGTISVSMGLVAAEKNFSLVFLPQNSCPVIINSKVTEQESSGQKVFLVNSRLVNETMARQWISLEKINGLPLGWKIDAEPLAKIGPQEQAVQLITLTPAGQFDGAAELVYRCGAFTEKRNVKIAFSPQNDFLAGFASLFSFDFFSGEFALNALLILVAAVLLIAFISRMVRKISANRPENAPGMNGFEVPQHEAPEIGGQKPSRHLSEIKKQVMKKK